MSSETKPEELSRKDINREINGSRINVVTSEIKLLTSESNTTSGKLAVLQSTIDSLKSDIQKVASKIELSVDEFKSKLSNKMGMLLNQLSDRQIHIQCTLENCYRIIANMVETFLDIGYGLEKDIASISLKVKNLDLEMEKLVSSSSILNNLTTQTDDEGNLWYINGEGKLTKSKCLTLGPVLPEFKHRDESACREFISELSNVFKQFGVPESLWVELATSQLSGMAKDWWQLNFDKDKSVMWEQFCKLIINWSFNDPRNNYKTNSDNCSDNNGSDRSGDIGCNSKNKNSTINTESNVNNNNNNHGWFGSCGSRNSKQDNTSDKNGNANNTFSESAYPVVVENKLENSNDCNGLLKISSEKASMNHQLQDHSNEQEHFSLKMDCSNSLFNTSLTDDSFSNALFIEDDSATFNSESSHDDRNMC